MHGKNIQALGLGSFQRVNILVYCGTITVLSPIVVVEWLKLPFRIREVLGTNLGAEAGYPD
jgi:hypothetical protein